MKAKESVDKLFAEPFEPRWMKWEREAAEHHESEKQERLLKHYSQRNGKDVDPLQVKTDAAWRVNAYRAHLRIVGRCQGSEYRNA